MTEEEKYIRKRLNKSYLQSIPFYLFRIFPIKRNKVVFTTIEGTTGFTCNPKYIAKELIKHGGLELVWLVDNTSKEFPKEIKVVKNTLINRAFQLTTARVWIDNSRKQLECRKRKGQTYIQTWHAKLGFKPTCLDRGASFSKIAYLVSKHDSDMVDYWLSNSDWYDKTLPTGSLYEGKTIRCGSPRCDILVKSKKDNAVKNDIKRKCCNLLNIAVSDNIDGIHFLMYAPTFRGGSQSTDRTLNNDDHSPDYLRLKSELENRFGGTWYILLRLHPQIVARNLDSAGSCAEIKDVSRVDDMYEILAGCDAFMTDYSSAAFDAAVMDIPVFLFCDDYDEYILERGNLLWSLDELPFIFSKTNDELCDSIRKFEWDSYIEALKRLFDEAGVKEDGSGSYEVVKKILYV